jgi:hypothetical protein
MRKKPNQEHSNRSSATLAAERIPERHLFIVFLAFLLSASILSLFVWVLFSFLPTDPGTLTSDLLNQMVPSVRNYVWPKPSEKTTLVSSLVVLPVILFSSVFLIQSWAKTKSLAFFNSNRWVLKVIFASLGALYVYGSLWSQISSMTFGYLFEPEIFICIAAGSAGVAWLVQKVHKISISQRTPTRTWVQGVVYLLIGILLVIASAWRVFDIKSVFHHGLYFDHFNAAFYSVTQSVVGKLPLVDFTSQYGFYGDLLTPWFKLIGLTVFSFTATLAFLQFVAMTSVVVFAGSLIRNSIVLLLFTCSFLLIINWFDITLSFEPYFQYWPVRFLFPALALPAFSKWQKNPDPLRTIFCSILVGVGLIWNVDSGIAIALCWIAIGIAKAVETQTLQGNWIGILKRLLISGLIIFGIVFSFILSLRLRSGGTLDLSTAFQYQKIFVQLGFYLLPMPREIHPWNLTLGLYLFCITLAVLKAFKIVTYAVIDSLFLLSVLGIGIFLYYTGRSHDFTFVNVMWPVPVILFVLLDRVITYVSKKALPFDFLLFFGYPILFMGVLSMVRLGHGLHLLTRWTGNHYELSQSSPFEVWKNSEFIQQNLNGEKECAIIARHAGVYFAENKLASAIPGPSVGQYILQMDLDRLLQLLSSGSPRCVFLEEEYLRPTTDKTTFALNLELLLKNYKPVAKSPDQQITYYVRR